MTQDALIYQAHLNLSANARNKIEEFLLKTLEEEDYIYRVDVTRNPKTGDWESFGIIDFFNRADYNYFMLIFNGEIL